MRAQNRTMFRVSLHSKFPTPLDATLAIAFHRPEGSRQRLVSGVGIAGTTPVPAQQELSLERLMYPIRPSTKIAQLHAFHQFAPFTRDGFS